MLLSERPGTRVRLTAAITPLVITVILAFSPSGLLFTHAFDLGSSIPTDHNHPIRIQNELKLEDTKASMSPRYDQDPFAMSLSPRAASDIRALANNDPQNKDIDAGETQHWVFPKEDITGPAGELGPGLPSDDNDESGGDPAGLRRELRKRQDSRTVYITANTCAQPLVNSPVAGSDTVSEGPPQLQMWISQSPSLTEPGPGSEQGQAQNTAFDGGYAIFEIDALDGLNDIYIGISAQNATDFTGVWNYEIAVSIDAPFHAIGANSTKLYFVDGDDHAALLVTDNTTQTDPTSEIFKQWMSVTPPYGFLAHNQNDPRLTGLENSFCGLRRQTKIAANIRGISNRNEANMIDRGGMGGKPKQEFYISNLNASSAYLGFLVMEGNSTASGANVVGGGGKVWSSTEFRTKTEPNCALLYNLTFCSEVAYAVPSNPDLFDPASEDGMSRLAALYDDNAVKLYKTFNYSLQQIPCQAQPLQQYSLVRDCSDCANAYKTWLCAVTIPRCEDFSSTKSFLMGRNIAADFINGSSSPSSSSSSSSQSLFSTATNNDDAWRTSTATNSSRNPLIDTDIKPGPYKEVLPCSDLCYDLMQSCPASFGFSCPLPNRGLEFSYGKKAKANRCGSLDGDDVTCSYPGAVHFCSGATGITSVLMTRGFFWPGLVAFAMTVLLDVMVEI